MVRQPRVKEDTAKEKMAQAVVNAAELLADLAALAGG